MELAACMATREAQAVLEQARARCHEKDRLCSGRTQPVPTLSADSAPLSERRRHPLVGVVEVAVVVVKPLVVLVRAAGQPSYILPIAPVEKPWIVRNSVSDLAELPPLEYAGVAAAHYM